MKKLCHPGAVSALTSGKSLPERTSPVRRLLAVTAVELVCIVVLTWSAGDVMLDRVGPPAQAHLEALARRAAARHKTSGA